ncbi:putative Alcohol dehydrogenase transcription factor Myb/SANT family protein [Tripterygium wilfordii]|uniref:Putative Alcohol dehydrogenase transcription factor Myb/SANT family protein n=1 Tax=Tripterygium wilfordii TaxID=458696 RepID=A0A7J7CM11_TRIWF|nr:protein FIP2-like [Tripterygium wilfordii]KAF5735115.1 putative Alcohol dehydrogenase transcription factor Myb/SANT family protein [Tripterygium wilfordii]
MSSPPASAATRRVPSPCWAHEETLALIKAYRDRWFSVSRGNLRASDWEDVAAALASAGATDGAPKTSIQCRHKIEKLRKRYRAEKQRALSKPGRFFSSWDLFPVLDSMEIGVVGSVQDKHIDKAVKSGNIGGNHNPNVEIGIEPVLPGFTAKSNRVVKPTLTFDCNYGGGFSVKSRDNELPPPPGLAYRSRAFPDFDDSDDDSMYGFPVKSLGDRNVMPLASRSVHHGKISSDRNRKPSIHCDHDSESDVDEGCGFGRRISGDWKSGPSGLRSNSHYTKHGNTGSHMDHGVLNGVSYSTRPGIVKKSEGGVKRGRGAVSEVVSSIKRLGEVFVKMEKMKMEAMREIEQMRMEIEMKHNQMILKSQQQVVNAFAEAFVEKTEKKKVKMVSTNGDSDGYEL